jgi:hypothetical protein
LTHDEQAFSVTILFCFCVVLFWMVGMDGGDEWGRQMVEMDVDAIQTQNA